MYKKNIIIQRSKKKSSKTNNMVVARQMAVRSSTAQRKRWAEAHKRGMAYKLKMEKLKRKQAASQNKPKGPKGYNAKSIARKIFDRGPAARAAWFKGQKGKPDRDITIQLRKIARQAVKPKKLPQFSRNPRKASGSKKTKKKAVSKKTKTKKKKFTGKRKACSLSDAGHHLGVASGRARARKASQKRQKRRFRMVAR